MSYIKDLVYLPPLPNDVNELKDRIIAASQSINPLQWLSQLKCGVSSKKRLDMVGITRGDHFEHI